MIQNPELPLQAYFSAAGSRWSIRSNSPAVLESAAETFPSRSCPGRADLNLDIYVDRAVSARPLWSVPQFRGRDHLVFADYGPNDSMLAGLQARHVIGRFSSRTAQAIGFWKRVIFPILLGTASPVVGVTPLHCACLQYKGQGLLITGESGAGKSTLSFELARRGLDFISDDWTYFSRAGTNVLAWGLPVNIKLLPDGIAHFPELKHCVPITHLNGELALEVDPERAGARRRTCCRPGMIFVLERQPDLGFEVVRLAENKVFAYFQRSLERLPGCLAESREVQLATIRALAQSKCWLLRCGGSPQEIATRVLQFCDDTSSGPSGSFTPLEVTRREWPDMLRRFVALPLQHEFAFGGCSFRVATNSERVARQLRQIAGPEPASTAPSIFWTIQQEEDWLPGMTALNGLACGPLSFLGLGGHSFLACDHHAGRAITFLAAEAAACNSKLLFEQW